MVWQKRLAASKLAERASKAVGLRHAGALMSRQAFSSRREKLLKLVKAFGNRCRFPPTIPATADVPLHSIGWTNALVEMAQQSRIFVHKYTLEHLRLIAQCKHLGLEQELGYCSLDAMLDAVASGKEWPVRHPHPMWPGALQQLLVPLGKQQLMPHQLRTCQHQRRMLLLFQCPLWH